MSERKPRRKSSRKSRIVLRLLVILAVCAVVFYYKDVIITPIKNILLGQDTAGELSFSGYTGSTFNSFDGGFVSVSAKGIKVVSLQNQVTLEEEAEISSPAVKTNGGYGVAFDIGGKTAEVFTESAAVYEINAEYPIIDASVNDEGFSAVCTQADGYNGLVSVYDAEGKLVFQWFSGDAFVLTARIASDSKTIAVLAVAESGSRIMFFSVGSEEEKGRFEAAGDVLLDMEFSGKKTVVTVSQKGVYTVGSDGVCKKQYLFGDDYLRNYAINDVGICYVILSKYQTGDECRAVAVKGDREVGTVDSISAVSDITCEGSKFAVLLGGKIEVYSKYGKLKDTFENISGVNEILMQNGKILAVKGYSALVLG